MLQNSNGMLVGILGCIGASLIHLIIGSLYQWGIINVYITSYYKIHEPSITLQGNAIAFPIMMVCIGLTMNLGLYLAEKTKPILVIAINLLVQALLIFVCSYIKSIGLFIGLYGAVFGLFSGLNFMVPIFQCNYYFPGRNMYVNGIILTGTGLGPCVFGLFSYSYLNPQKLKTLNGYYLGTNQLDIIAQKVPQYLRWLSLIYLCIGILGFIMILPLCLSNQRKRAEQKKSEEEKLTSVNNQIQIKKQANQINNKIKNQVMEQSQVVKTKKIGQIEKKQIQNMQNSAISLNMQKKDQKSQQNSIQLSSIDQRKQPHSLKQSISTKLWWYESGILFFSSCGLLLMNGNYKTYVKNTIADDQFLTLIGVAGSIGNGCSRFLWNYLLSKTGYRFLITLNVIIQIIIYVALRFTVTNYGGFLFLIFVINFCIGGIIGTTPTFLQLVFGMRIGSAAYGFFWQIFSLANILQYVYVSQVSKLITFNGVIYICLGMALFAGAIVNIVSLKAPWNHCQKHLGYFLCWKQLKKSQ